MGERPRIVIVGAGGHTFPVRLSYDLLSYPDLRSSELVLYDIDADRIEYNARRIEALIERFDLPTTVLTTTDRRAALEGADYVVTTFQVGGLDAFRLDIEIPRRHGVDQAVGDTLGPGGVFRALRSAPVFVELARDLSQLAPGALVLQYANPMAINCWILREAGANAVGLCHSIQGTSSHLAELAGLELDELEFRAAGINHVCWFTDFTRDGVDVHPQIKAAVLERFPQPDVLGPDGLRRDAPAAPPGHESYDLVRAEILRTFGYFHSESSHHASEYYPWFRKSPQMTAAYIPSPWSYYETSKAFADTVARGEMEHEEPESLDERSEEYCARIISAREGGEPAVIYGNVPNELADGELAIANLPHDAIVEVACRVDRDGLTPQPYGELPPQCAAINAQHVGMQRLAVRAALHGDREAALHAIALDPYTSAILTLPEIRRMAGELFEAQARWLPQFAPVGAVSSA